ncbi:MAG: amidophosphoribosyltransferase [Coriobacteriales bacterium]|jgi:amidophosphoribosyltransferase
MNDTPELNSGRHSGAPDSTAGEPETSNRGHNGNATHSDDIRIDDDHLDEECGVFGVFAPGRDVARITYFGLHALQHRGQESAGIAVGDGYTVTATKDMGLVTQVFDEAELSSLSGFVAIGHCRYSTSGGYTSWENAQPHLSVIGDKVIALAHNGTLVNTHVLRSILIDKGISFRSNTDSEVAARLIGYFTQKTSHMREGIRKTMHLISGAYAVALITDKALYAFRDPNGIRPLCIGKFPDGSGWIVSSETCGLDIVGAEYVRDVEPGEIVKIDEDGVVSEQGLPAGRRASCIFEYVYFARPDSVMDGAGIYRAREAMGRRLSVEAPVDADIVMGVPDSGTPAAIGYARESGIVYTEGVTKNRYIGRTFIQPTQELRQRGIRLKLNPLPYTLRNRRVIVVDDSIVRGNTSKQLVAMLREAGAKEVHMRIVSPPVAWPCFYGIDTDVQKQLIAANMDVPQICEFIGADSLAYLSLEGLISCIYAQNPGFCTACFSGVYPVRLPKQIMKDCFKEGMEPTFWQNSGSAGIEGDTLWDLDEWSENA